MTVKIKVKLINEYNFRSCSLKVEKGAMVENVTGGRLEYFYTKCLWVSFKVCVEKFLQKLNFWLFSFYNCKPGKETIRKFYRD